MTASLKNFDKALLRDLNKSSYFPWLKDAFMDWAVIAITIYLSALVNNPLAYLVAIFVIGNRQHALAILGHDGTHYTISKNRKINDFISDFFAFWLLGLTTSGYRNLHFAHHKDTNTERDPELLHRSSRAPQWDLPITVPKILKYGLMDMVGYSTSDYFMIVMNAKPNSKLSYIPMIGMHLFFIGAFLYAGLWVIPLLWYVSLLTAFMMYFRFRTWLEHQGTDGTHRLKLNCFEGMILAPHDVWHHYEHHTCSSVPYHRLREVRDHFSDEPVITLRELINRFRRMPEIPSGKPLKA